MAFKGMLRHPLSVSSEQLGRTCQEGWGALGPRLLVGFALGCPVISSPLFICITICF